MRNTTTIALAVCLAGGLLLGGCSKKADTPKEAMETFATGMMEGDVDAVMAVSDLTEQQKPAVEAMCGALKAMMEFGKAFEEEYGESAEGTNMADEYKKMKEELDKVAIKIDGDNATAKTPDGKTMDLAKVDGGWKLKISENMPEGEKAKKMAERMKKMEELFKDLKSKVGKMSKEELGKEIMKGMLGGPSQ
jgi:hypothetical protein